MRGGVSIKNNLPALKRWKGVLQAEFKHLATIIPWSDIGFID